MLGTITQSGIEIKLKEGEDLSQFAERHIGAVIQFISEKDILVRGKMFLPANICAVIVEGKMSLFIPSFNGNIYLTLLDDGTVETTVDDSCEDTDIDFGQTMHLSKLQYDEETPIETIDYYTSVFDLYGNGDDPDTGLIGLALISYSLDDDDIPTTTGIVITGDGLNMENMEEADY